MPTVFIENSLFKCFYHILRKKSLKYRINKPYLNNKNSI